MPRPWNAHLKAWKDRLSALKNLPPVLALLWQSGRGTVAAGIGFRLVGALLPLAALWVGKLIIDLIVGAIRHPGPVPSGIWLLLAAEFAIAALGAILGRASDYCDGRLADQFAREVSVRVMKHAATLDLESFEDPVFYDKLERDIVPMFYGRPNRYSEIMRYTIALNASFFNTQRMVLQYISNAYKMQRDVAVPAMRL